MNRTTYLSFFLSAWCLILAGCAETMLTDGETAAAGDLIVVGVETSGLQVTSDMLPIGQTRAAGAVTDAEKVSWLVQPLKQGLDITYGKVGDQSTEQVAILKLLPDEEGKADYKTHPISGLAVYSFNNKTDDSPAKWFGNGPHYFEGVHVPTRLRFSTDASDLESGRTAEDGSTIRAVKDLTTNQSGDTDTGKDNDLGNYTLLSHYLGMPANTRISATVERIKLPFRHRLAHVLAYIIIDPSLETQIDGYTPTEKDQAGNITQKDDPNTSAIKFCNVDVLKGVKEGSDASGQQTLTPVWAEKVRKVTPHFWGEVESMVVYEKGKETVYPRSSNYAAVAANPTGYTQVTYNKVPVYDLIVRPTYTSEDNVMYDEEGYNNDTKRKALAARTNQIDFAITLQNGLIYEKSFLFDLDANYETVVYLHITREGVDYNESGAAVWEETKQNDDWFGVDNKNGHTLSQAGSSWQRAYTRRNDKYINDGGDHVTDGGFYDEGTKGEDDATGQYLREATWIKYFSEAHEGGAHHGDYFNLSFDITIDARCLPDTFVFTGHLDGFGQDDRQYHTITLTYTDTPWKEYVETTDYSLANLYATKPTEAYSDDETPQFSLPELYTKTDHEEVYCKVTPTLAEVMTGNTQYYTCSGEDTYTEYVKPKILYKIVQHTSGTALFAGLNGIYSTKQETETNYTGPWEANVHKEVHKEVSYWLPYKEATSGWRAEVMNLTVKGAKLFKEGAVITGNVDNCKDGADGTDKVTDHIPALPKYK